MTDIKELRSKRKTIKASLTRFKNYVNEIDENNIDFNLLKVKLEKLEPLWDKFDAIQSEIELDESAFDKENKEREAFENDFCLSVSMARNLLDNQFINQDEDNKSIKSNVSESFKGVVRLPKIELPVFDGKWEEFRSFKEEFNSLIDSREDLAPVQKFRYLIRTLKGDAALVIKAMEVTNENYKEAWAVLEDRFDNKRRIVSKHIRAILDVEPIEKPKPLEIQKLRDTISSHLRAIKAMGYPTEQWDVLLVVIIVKKLDTITRQKWEQVGNKNEMPSLSQLMSFLQDRVNVLETWSEDKSNMQTNKFKDLTKRMPFKSKSLVSRNQAQDKKKTNSVVKDPCEYCGMEHKIYVCQLFRKLAVPNRILEINKLGLCENCFRKGHLAGKCQGLTCRKCSKPHNSLLHIESEVEKKPDDGELLSRNAFAHGARGTKPMIFLSTAVVHVLNRDGHAVECRVLLDSGAQSNFISQRLAKQLALPLQDKTFSISGIGGKITEPLNSVCGTVKSRFEQVNLDLEFVVLPKITLPLPEIAIDITAWKIPKEIFLADPTFYSSGAIDMLIGAEQFFNIVKWKQIPLGEGLPTLQSTAFGWVIVGKLKNPKKRVISAESEVLHCGCSFTIEENLKKFWESEECSLQPVMSIEEKQCEKKFMETTKRDSDGRFVVSLPIKDNIKDLGDSEQIALKRFYHLEKRLQKDEALKSAYCQFMEEYEKLGHMQEVADVDVADKHRGYHIPHHCVLNMQSSTTKLRVVFDASAKTTTNLSLNDALMVGPTIQQDLLSIILRFRQHKYVITADITKMYRQIKVTEEDSKLQKIFWRDHPNKTLKKYQLTTVTYGTAPASYLATRCLKQAALDNIERLPSGSASILADFYMDDLVHGHDSLESISISKREIIQILREAGFELHKWCSNEPTLLADIPVELIEKKYIPDQADSTIKALGIWWNPVQDNLKFAINISEKPTLTKRGVLGEAARLFDPMGLAGPIVIKAKIFLQGLWAAGVNWDESLSQQQEQEWIRFRDELKMLERIAIPRSVRHDYSSEIELHGFSDASEKAYGAAVYIKTVNSSGHAITNLLCAKSRVAPLKRLTLPRLELCGALLLARLIQKVRSSLTLNITKYFLWSDSTIVLAWLRSPASRWRTFVANRVSEIQESTIACEWRHVESAENPADKISRGLFPSEIINDRLWWHGPEWLEGDSSEYPSGGEIPQNIVEEQKAQSLLATTVQTTWIDWKRFSSFSKLVRVIIYVRRFCLMKMGKVTNSALTITSEEWISAERIVVRMVQREEFLSEIEALKSEKEIKSSSKLLSLCPFVDTEGLLRVGGRIGQAEIAYDQKHPLLLPSKHWVTDLLMKYYHLKHLHAGAQSLLATVRRKFWPVNGKNLAKRAVKSCIICSRWKPKEMSQLMGELPKERLSNVRPFLHTGVDYCGPILIKVGNYRNAKSAKAYIAIFVCLVTKAVHIELVSDMTTETFLGSLKRFFARRGKAKVMFSDNGTNFIGAQRSLHKNFMQAVRVAKIDNYLAEENITWKFIPPRAPQFGGLWEAAVKAFKYHFKRIIGQMLLTYEEMSTFVALIESILNSRPLYPLSSNPNDLIPITPGHFLIGDAMTALPDVDTPTQKISTISRWRRVEHMFQQFWTRWSKEYLATLQQRNKWRQQKPNLREGQLVMLKEDNLPPLKWPMARVIAIHPGEDNLVRVVTVKTAQGVFKRPVSKLCCLPIADLEENEETTERDEKKKQ